MIGDICATLFGTATSAWSSPQSPTLSSTGSDMLIGDIIRIMMASGCLILCIGWVTVAIINAVKGRKDRQDL